SQGRSSVTALPKSPYRVWARLPGGATDEVLLDPADEGVDGVGLNEVVVGQAGHGGDLFGGRGRGGGDEDRPAGSRAGLAEFAAEFKGGGVGKLHVEHDEVGPGALDEGGSLRGRAGEKD